MNTAKSAHKGIANNRMSQVRLFIIDRDYNISSLRSNEGRMKTSIEESEFPRFPLDSRIAFMYNEIK